MSVRLLLLCTIIASFTLLACSSDCIYKKYTTKAGDELCGRFCPLEDEDGNDVLDDDGEVVYDKPETVNNVNCTLPTTTTTTSGSSSSTAG